MLNISLVLLNTNLQIWRVKTFAIESATYRIGHLIELKYQSLLSSGMSSSESKLSAIREYAIECSI